MDINFQASWEKLLTKMAEWADHLIIMLPNALVSIIALVIFIVIARLLRKGFLKLINQFSDNYAINNLLGRAVGIGIIMLGIFVVLSIMKLDKTVTSLLAGAGIIGLAIGFAFQDLIANLISGVMIAIRKPFRKGDLIQTNDVFGNVVDMDLRNTIIRVPQGQKVIIPNKDVFQKAIKNFTTGERRIDLAVGVGYASDLAQVEKIAIEAVADIPYLGEGKDVELHFTEFGSSSINFLLFYWIDLGKQQDFFRAQSDGIKRIKAAFNKNNINIPFPIRTLEIGPGSKQILSKQLNEQPKNILNN